MAKRGGQWGVSAGRVSRKGKPGGNTSVRAGLTKSPGKMAKSMRHGATTLKFTGGAGGVKAR